MLLEASIMLLEASIMLLEWSLMVLENIYRAGVTHDDHYWMIIIVQATGFILLASICQLHGINLTNNNIGFVNNLIVMVSWAKVAQWENIRLIIL